ncbi:hypothetical protein K458DRAFT_6566 [Lentithecium fluviatile CBS 122367]|uniref:RING-type domain-containing protein n=1 Tax=Lentithecium fluviatile CBS 122367 TaxID=1168545 RepID=A0A6G1JMS0_9PLEO|nr:hypothetical protein K458DRAFT_6566 [Lentithecium fluviatile CBS 122367]
MGNASAKLSDPEDRSRRSLGSRSTLVRRSKRVWTSLRPHRGARLVSKLILCGTSDDGVEERPQRRLRKACRDVPARRATGRRSRDRRPVAGQTDGEEHDWTPSDEKLGSQDRDSISFAKLDDHSAVTQESVEKDTKPRKECTICTESRLLSRFPKCPPTRSCTHSPDTCRRCLRKWITTSFTSKIWYHIDCPECNERLSYIDVKAFADPTLFFKYNELATKASLEEVPGFRWCLTRKCDSGQVHLEEKGPKFVCIRCNGEYCVVHQVRWHKKETCAEYEYR